MTAATPREEYQRRESRHREGVADAARLEEKISGGRLGLALVAALIAWQAFGAVGYNWTPSISSTLGFRALYAYDQQFNNVGGSFRIHETLYAIAQTIQAPHAI